METGESDGDDAPPAKKAKLDPPDAIVQPASSSSANPDIIGGRNHSTVNESSLKEAKGRLSKWASRLFDPDRPKGLVEAPKVIPLNDEFLTAFGKREKDHNMSIGLEIEIDNRIDDADEGDDEDQVATAKSSSSKKRAVNCKVKVNNLKYTTTSKRLTQACEKYGSVEYVNLLMEDGSDTINKGRAYVTFEAPEAAQECIDGLKSLDGRSLTVTLASDPFTSTATSKNGASARYWIPDISTKCYRCGKVGHKEDVCENAPKKLKPCPLCASSDHDFRDCPGKAICFNCGVPGHISRDCPHRRGMPPRQLDEIGALQWISSAICMVCNQRGHFMCKNYQWEGGQGRMAGMMSCWNCGAHGHSGHQCGRPNLETLCRSEHLIQPEIARSAEYATEEMIREQEDSKNRRRNERQQRGYNSNRNGGNIGRDPQNQSRGHFRGIDVVRRRAKSAPPNRGHHRRQGR